jgi:hypothetical protein
MVAEAPGKEPQWANLEHGTLRMQHFSLWKSHLPPRRQLRNMKDMVEPIKVLFT